LLASSSLWAATPRPASHGKTLEGEIQRFALAGFELRQKASAVLPGGKRLLAMVFGRPDGTSFRLTVYEIKKTARLIHFEPSVASIRLAPIHDGGKIPDFIGDGSRVLAYILEFPGLQQRLLTLMRYAGGKFTRIGQPLESGEFEDIALDGRLEIVSHERPLGQFFSLSCDSFFTMAQTARRTRIHALESGGLRTISAEFPAFYRAHISNLEAELASNNPVKTGHYGDYLGSALSLYFDYEETGRRKEGWDRLQRAFRLPAAAPGKVKDCMLEMGSTLRRKLNIPPEWD
jgi:hypothetical protein